jgi:hypothetical protein
MGNAVLQKKLAHVRSTAEGFLKIDHAHHAHHFSGHTPRKEEEP